MFKQSLFFLFSLSALANSSYVSNTQTLSEDGYELKVVNDYFQTSALVDVNGRSENLKENEAYSTLNTILGFKYAPTSNLEIYGDVGLRVNQSSEQDGTSPLKLNAMGLESAYLGIDYGSDRSEGFQYKIKTRYRQSFYRNEDYVPNSNPRDHIVLGDGSNGYLLGLGLSFVSKANNFYEFDLDFKNPSDRLSSELLINTKIAIAWTPVTLILGVEYLASLGQDEFADNPADKVQISTGSTNLYNSINRSYTEPYVGFNFKLGTTWRLETKVGQRISGTSTDLGLRGGFSLIKRVSNSNNFKNKNSTFKQYEIEGIVTKITKSRKAVIVDQGVSSGLNKGDRVDFYHFDFVDGDELIGSGIVIKSSYDKAMVKVSKKYSKRKIKDGTVIRSGLIR